MEINTSVARKIIILVGLAVIIPFAIGEYKFHPKFHHHNHQENGTKNATDYLANLDPELNQHHHHHHKNGSKNGTDYLTVHPELNHHHHHHHHHKNGSKNATDYLTILHPELNHHHHHHHKNGSKNGTDYLTVLHPELNHHHHHHKNGSKNGTDYLTVLHPELNHHHHHHHKNGSKNGTDYLTILHPELHQHPKNGSKNGTHDLIIGNPTNGDVLLYHSGITAAAAAAGKNIESINYDIQYPPFGTNNKTISYIIVKDMLRSGTNGYPSLKQGGIGYNYTVINLRSQIKYGLNFTVTIYGNNKPLSKTIN